MPQGCVFGICKQMVRKDACLFSVEVGKSYTQNMYFMRIQSKYNILDIYIKPLARKIV